jgi:hypothetical protein
MESFQEKLKDPIFLMFMILLCISLYMTSVEYFFETGQKFGKELIIALLN